jgi:phage N-6-adenine-methyltransferase
VTAGVHFSSVRQDWATPWAVFNQWNNRFCFTLDVCASADNAKCERYYDIQTNGLAQDWSKDVCWMNPPYGREIVQWVQKAYEESLRGAVVVCLLPSRTDTGWWHSFVIPGASQIHYLRGRIRFEGAEHSAPFPSAVVVFGVPR